MIDDKQKALLINLETTISEVMENISHPVHDPKHPKHPESIAAFNKLLVLRESMVILEHDQGVQDDL